MRILIAVILLMLCSACGFHLRGTVQGVAGVSVYNQTPKDQLELENLLNDGIQQASMTLAPDLASAAMVLNVTDVRVTRRVQTVTSFGRAQDYELILSVNYQIGSPKDFAAQKSLSVDARREYNYANTDVLGNAEEEALLIREMQREVVARLLRQVTFNATQRQL